MSPFPFEQAKAETLRSLAKDLGLPHKASARREDMIRFFRLIEEKGLEEARSSFVSETQDYPLKRKREDEETPSASSPGKRTRPAPSQEEKPSKAVSTSGTRSSGRKESRIRTQDPSASSELPQEEESVSAVRKSSRAGKKSARALAAATSAPPSSSKRKSSSNQNGKSKSHRHGKQVLDAVVLPTTKTSEKQTVKEAKASTSVNENTGEDLPMADSASAVDAEGEDEAPKGQEVSEQNAEGSKDENASDKENMPAPEQGAVDGDAATNPDELAASSEVAAADALQDVAAE